MDAVLRVPLALGLLAPTLTLYAQTAELPPIFAPRPAPESAVASARHSPALPLSLRTRSLMRLATDSVLAETPRFESSAPPRYTADYSALASGDTVVMSRYVVTGAAPRSIPVRVSDSPVMNFLKTGVFTHKLSRHLVFHFALRILPVAQTQRNGAWEFAMPQIGFRLSW